MINEDGMKMAEKIALTARDKLLQVIAESLEDYDITDADRERIKDGIADELLDVAEMFQSFGFDASDFKIELRENGDRLDVVIKAGVDATFGGKVKNYFNEKLN